MPQEKKTSIIPTEDRFGLLVRSNALIRSRYKASMLESKLMSLALYRLQKNRKTSDSMAVSFTTAELVEFLGINANSGLYERIRRAAVNLMDHKILLESGERFVVFAIVTTAVYENGKLTIVFNRNVRQHLFSLKSAYTPMSLSVLLGFDSTRDNFALRIYELLRINKYKITKSNPECVVGYSLTALKTAIGVYNIDDPAIRDIMTRRGTATDEQIERVLPKNRMYDRYSDFSRRVLLPAQKEISEKTDIRFSFEPVRSGRGGKTVGVAFHITNNPDFHLPGGRGQNAAEPAGSPEDEVRELEEMESIIKEPMRIASLRSILKASGYNLDRVRAAYALSRRQDHIDNLAGWMVRCLKEQYSGDRIPAMRGVSPEKARLYADIADEFEAEQDAPRISDSFEDYISREDQP